MPAPQSFVSLDHLIQNSRRRLIEDRARKMATPLPADTAFVTGFHAYSDIHLTYALAAAEDTKTAQRYLDILTAYADIATGAAQVAGARVLEVQGERLHFFIEAPAGTQAPTADLWGRLLSLSRAVITLAYERLEPLAGSDLRGCRMAADFGSAALLYSNCGGGSLVSLGDCANRPAKRLGQSPIVGAGHLAVPAELAPKQLGGSPMRGWVEVNLREPSEVVLRAIGPDYSGPLRNFLNDLARSNQARPVIGQVSPEFFDNLGAGRALQPVQMQGFTFRADLDGFTKQIKDAFAAGPEAVFALVHRFRQLLDFPERFAAELGGRAVILPWAGDCATILIVPPASETFATARTYLPVRAALAWHTTFAAERRYVESVTGARWALGLAAGDADEGNEGRVLLADLPAAERTFRVIAGWAARLSNDAYQCDGVVGGDTVITRIDHDHLWEKHATAFKPLETDFSRATIEQLQKDAAASAQKAAVSESPRSSVGPFIPSPRPHYVQR